MRWVIPTPSPATTGADIGPLISARARDGVAARVAEAVADGARISRQSVAPKDGFFYPPTLLVDVPAHAQVVREEVFGPVAPVLTWRNEDELLALVNDTEMGLAAYVYAGELRRALKLAERIEAGMVGINRGIVSDPAAPFGGVKQSGIGREGAREGIKAFTETQMFSVDWG